LIGHEKWGRAYWYYGATERHLYYPIVEEADRRAVEEDLIRGLKPPMNDVAIPNPARSKRVARAQQAPLHGARPALAE
jgi:hypothetical protein